MKVEKKKKKWGEGVTANSSRVQVRMRLLTGLLVVCFFSFDLNPINLLSAFVSFI